MTNQEGCNCKEEHIEGEDVTHLGRTRSADQEVEEARWALNLSWVGPGLNPFMDKVDALIEAVRRQERERVYAEEKDRVNREMRAMSDRAMSLLRARSSEEAGNGSSVA